MSRFVEYRFTKKDGTLRYEFLERGNITQLKAMMSMHDAVKAEPVEPPACVRCSGPICPIIEPEE